MADHADKLGLQGAAIITTYNDWYGRYRMSDTFSSDTTHIRFAK